MQPQHVSTLLEALILAVAHKEYIASPSALYERIRDGGVMIDVKSSMPHITPPRGIRLWSL